MLMALLGLFLSRYQYMMMNTRQVKCISFERRPNLGSISLGMVGWHTQHRNLGFRTKRSAATFYSGRLSMPYATAKVNPFFQVFACPLTIFEVLRQCALEKDLELFEAGDNTEVGEKGLTLRYFFLPSLMDFDYPIQKWWTESEN